MAFPNYFLGEVLQAVTIPACVPTVTLNVLGTLSQAAPNAATCRGTHDGASRTGHASFGHVLALLQLTPTQRLLTAAAFFGWHKINFIFSGVGIYTT